MSDTPRCLCDERGERPRVTKNGYLYFTMAPGCPEHDARTTQEEATP